MTLSIARAHDILHHAELLCSHEQVQAALHKVAQQINAKPSFKESVIAH